MCDNYSIVETELHIVMTVVCILITLLFEDQYEQWSNYHKDSTGWS